MENRSTPYLLGIIRISLGLIFFWAFWDKTLGLGISTLPEKAWINGGSPTLGYLKFAVSGPFAGIFHNMAGHPVVDWLFMSGLLGVGLTLTLGIMVRAGAVSAIAMLLLMYVSVLPPENHPFLNDHLVYCLALLVILAENAGQKFGLGSEWRKLPLVRRNKILE